MNCWFRLLPEFTSDTKAIVVDFDTTAVRVLQEDLVKLSERMVSVVTGGIATVAEGREPLGLEINESHDIFLRPLNLIETPADGSEQDEPDEPDEPAPPPEDDPPTGDDDPDS